MGNFNNLFRFYEGEEKQAVILTFGVGLIIFILNLFLFYGKTTFVIYNTIFGFVAVIIALGPFAYFQYKSYRISKEIESNFSYFLIGVSEGLESNMSLPNALKYSAKNDYGVLDPYINKIISQISWGVTLDKILIDFADRVNNPVIKRSVSTIIETYNSGGNLASSLSAVASYVTEIEKVRNERLSRLSNNMLQNYVIYFVFLVILVGIQQILLPIFMKSGFGVVSSASYGISLSQLYSVRFRDLAVMQGLFSGLIIGKLSSGTLASGLKHSAIMVFIGYVVLTISSALI
ncbi:MAG: type II secretion system F family protein [DPANN group archaeon]|nr:type II secretion system F family protein [DPANN group archaeon]